MIEYFRDAYLSKLVLASPTVYHFKAILILGIRVVEFRLYHARVTETSAYVFYEYFGIVITDIMNTETCFKTYLTTRM